MGFNRTDPTEVARAMLDCVRAGSSGNAPLRPLAPRLRQLLRDLRPGGDGVGRAMYEVSRQAGLANTGRMLGTIYSLQEKSAVTRLVNIIITLGDAHAQGAC